MGGSGVGGWAGRGSICDLETRLLYFHAMTSRDQVIKNLDSLIQQIGPLQNVLALLSKTSIRYGLYAGSHVAVLTNNRSPQDVDFLVHDDDIDELRKVFSTARIDESGPATFLYVDNDNLIEFMARASIRIEEAVFPFRLTDLACQHIYNYETKLGTINIVDPVDTLLLKAILQRGGIKHDLEDVSSVLAEIEIDRKYLQARIKESKAGARTVDIWRRFGIQI